MVPGVKLMPSGGMFTIWSMAIEMRFREGTNPVTVRHPFLARVNSLDVVAESRKVGTGSWSTTRYPSVAPTLSTVDGC